MGGVWGGNSSSFFFFKKKKIYLNYFIISLYGGLITKGWLVSEGKVTGRILDEIGVAHALGGGGQP